MAVTGVLHHIGTFLLFAGTVLLIITNITAPVVHNISLMSVRLNNATGQFRSTVNLGTYGYCLVDARVGNGNDRADFCSPSMVGYSPTDVVGVATGIDYYPTADSTTRTLTKVMILHPIAAGVAFIAFALSLSAGTFGSLLASMVALLAFVVTLVVLITDFILFGIVRAGVNESGSGAEARWGTGLWSALAAAVCLLLGTVVVFFTCCSARIRRRREVRTTKTFDGYVPPLAPRRRRWF